MTAEKKDENRRLIDIPQAPEVNPEVYKDVEALLFRGFLVASGTINGIPFVFKSLNHHEFDLLRLRMTGQEDTSAYYDMFLAYSVFMVSGSSVLANRERWLPDIAQTFRVLPQRSKNRVIRIISDLNRRVSNAVLLTEAYAMEPYSRVRWQQLKGYPLNSTQVNGIPGADLLGLNWAQLVWNSINQSYDLQEQVERDWDNAKFIGSCFAGKGLATVYKKDEKRRQKEKENKLARKDKILRHVFYGEPMTSEAGIEGNEVVIRARTVKDLVRQMENSLRGEQDWHDHVVATFEEQQRKKLEEKRQAIESMYQGNASDNSIVGTTSLDGLTQDDVQKRAEATRKRGDEAILKVPSDEIDKAVEKWTSTSVTKKR